MLNKLSPTLLNNTSQKSIPVFEDGVLATSCASCLALQHYLALYCITGAFDLTATPDAVAKQIAIVGQQW